MSRDISTVKRYVRERVARDRYRVYLFGDNLVEGGSAGQACIRGLPNAIGIPTKKYPRMDEGAFFSDQHFNQNVGAIERAFRQIPPDVPVVLPAHGLGTGLAQLKRRAPKTWDYLLWRICQLRENGK